MKIILTILLLKAVNNCSFGQSSVNNDSLAAVISEIGKNGIENLYLGCGDCLSEKRLKADSVFRALPIETVIDLTRHSSYTIKYYSFLRLLKLDDRSAFNFVKEMVRDSTEIDILGACMSRTVGFNVLIASEYKRFIYYKSKSISFSIDGRSYWFDKPDRRLGKARMKELNALLNFHSLKI